MTAIERSPFKGFGGPAYQYIRTTDKLPTIAEALDVEDPIAKVKLFALGSSWTWYIAAYDPETRNAFALVDGHELEAGVVHIPELLALKSFGLPIERDLHWTPRKFSEIK